MLEPNSPLGHYAVAQAAHDSWEQLEPHLAYLGEDRCVVEEVYMEATASLISDTAHKFFNESVELAILLAKEYHADASSLCAVLLQDGQDMKRASPETAVFAERVYRIKTEPDSVRILLYFATKDMRLAVIACAMRLVRLQQWTKAQDATALIDQTRSVHIRLAQLLNLQELANALEEQCIRLRSPELHQLGICMRDQQMQTVTTYIPIALQETLLDMDVLLEYQPISWIQLSQHYDTFGTLDTLPLVLNFTCSDSDRCYRLLGLLHQTWQQQVGALRDTIGTPQVNGDRSLQTTIALSDTQQLQCTIRTNAMADYAKHGVGSLCFADEPVMCLQQYYPWLQSVHELLEEDISDAEFTTIAERDILCEYVCISSQESDYQYIPAHASTLDAAFYCVGERALWTESIAVNDGIIGFEEPLQSDARVQINLSDARTVKRNWLGQAQTHFSQTIIHNALETRPNAQQVIIGQRLLQTVLTRKASGFIEEFDQAQLVRRLPELDMPNLETMYCAIANGRLDPEAVYHTLFTEDATVTTGPKKRYLCRLDADDTATMKRCASAYKRYGAKVVLPNIYERFTSGHSSVLCLQANLSQEQEAQFLYDLKTAGVDKIQIGSPAAIWHKISAICALSVLWGVHPVLTKLLLNAGLATSVFAVLRIWVLGACAAGLLLATRKRNWFVSIPIFNRTLWLSGFAFGLMSISMYWAIDALSSPTLYRVMMRLSTLFFAVPMLWQHRSYTKLGTSALLTTFGLMLLWTLPNVTTGLLLGLGSSLLYGIYVMCSRHYQQHERVMARYPMFFFCSTAIAALTTIPLLPFALNTPLPSGSLIAAAIALVVACSAIPYYLLYRLMQQSSYVAGWLNTYLLVSIAAEVLLLGTSPSVALIGGGICLVLVSLLTADAEKGYLSTTEKSASTDY